MREKICGVYMIQSKIKPERIYIGSSANIIKRWYEHKYRAKKGIHHSVQLRRHVTKYGINDLVFSIVESFPYSTEKYLFEREEFYIKLYAFGNADKPYFNCTFHAGSCLGVKQSEESCNKRSLSTKGRPRGPQTEEHKKNRVESRLRGGKGNGLKGKPKPLETRQKIRNTLMGRKPPPKSEEGIQRLKIAATGKIKSEESKKKQSETRRKNKYVPWNKGLTKDTDERIREASKKRNETVRRKKH